MWSWILIVGTDMSHVFTRRDRMLHRLYGVALCLCAQKVAPGIEHPR